MSENRRGHYGPSRVAAATSGPSGSSSGGFTVTPWLIGGVGLALVGVAVLGTQAAKRPRLSAHEKEMRAWKAEFPGLPWYMDEVKDARQLDMWERARDHWERTHAR